MIRKNHKHKPQTTPWHREEEPPNHHETPGRQIKQSNQPYLPHQDDCNTRIDIKYNVLVCDVLLWSCHFPIGILGRVWCLIVSIPDLCPLSHLVSWVRCGTWLYRFLIFAPLLTYNFSCAKDFRNLNSMVTWSTYRRRILALIIFQRSN